MSKELIRAWFPVESSVKALIDAFSSEFFSRFPTCAFSGPKRGVITHCSLSFRLVGARYQLAAFFRKLTAALLALKSLVKRG